ncbi:hypothetical protein [Neotabrizicola sp. VNH66]|uniref:hypothetical protein n=1 Tax=Neotabrizicola sp. VNH66 TaxID=3400918 RepID=UPI003BFB072C
MADRHFAHTGRPGRVTFGTGPTVLLPEGIIPLGARRVLLLSTAQQETAVRQLAKRLGPVSAGIGQAVDLPLSTPYRNPPALNREGLTTLIICPRAGLPPMTSAA